MIPRCEALGLMVIWLRSGVLWGKICLLSTSHLEYTIPSTKVLPSLESLAGLEKGLSPLLVV